MAVDNYQEHVLYCPIADQYYSAMEEIHGNQGMIVSFSMEKAPAGRVTIHPRMKFCRPASPALRGCLICRSRVSCSCDCLKTHLQCEKKVGYRFQCLYCRQLRVVTVEGSQGGNGGK